jgi:class 3 adenylate cyclase/tetratricopeptide (TPR) repeat protein
VISCRHCQAENASGSRYCENCGNQLDRMCTACGVACRLSARFCRQCGALLAPETTAPLAAEIARKDVKFLDEGERKHVTVLFADVRGSTQLIAPLDPETAMHQLDPTVQSMIAAVVRFGGVVNRMQGDGIMALFGAPLACEDHAVRACLAGVGMIEAVAALHDASVKIRVGIDSGEVIIRATGRDASDYDATGVIAHIASRVEQHASPGTVLITARTAAFARGYVDLAPVGRLTVKGLAQPLEAFQLLSAVDRPSWEVRCAVHGLHRLVGREVELSQLAAALGKVGRGHGQAITIVGEAGFGKSRLVHEFLRSLPSGSWNVLRVAAVSHTTVAPYHLAAELLRSWLAVDASDDRAEVARKLKQTLTLIDPDGATDLAPLQSLLDLTVEDGVWARLAPSLRRNRTLAALRNVVLLEAALRPLIMLIEDYHWVDPPSAELLEGIADGLGAAKLFLLVTTRPDRRIRWAGRNYSAELHLPPLPAESAEALLCDLIGASEQTRLARKRILEQAGGVPLFLEEIARAFTESGVAVSDGGISELNIPASVQAIIATRIDRLPPLRRRLLQVASVIGKDVPLALLQFVADMPPEQLECEIAELRVAEFLYELNISSDIELTFRHALIQTVAYEGMLRKHRRDLHARVMGAIETLFADRLDEFTERLADHAMRGESWDAALSYAFKAGDRAIGRWAWRQAITYYDNAIAALDHLPENSSTLRLGIEARLRLRVALPGVADLPRIARCLDKAREFAETLDDQTKLAEIDTSKCLTATKMGLLDQAIEAGRQGYALSRDLQNKAALLNSSFALAQAYWYQGEFGRAQELVSERLPDIRGDLQTKQTGTTGTASLLALVCLAKTQAITGQFTEAFATITEGRGIATDTGKPFDLSYCKVGRGFCLLMHNEPWAAVKDLEEALHLARSGDIALLIPSSERYLGRAYALTGRLQEARDLLRGTIDRTAASGLLGMRLWSSAALGLAEMLAAAEPARETLMTTLESARRYGFRPLQAHLMRLIGNLDAMKTGQDPESADTWYQRAIRMADELGMRPEAAQARRDLATWLQRAGPPRPASEVAEHMIDG